MAIAAPGTGMTILIFYAQKVKAYRMVALVLQWEITRTTDKNRDVL